MATGELGYHLRKDAQGRVFPEIYRVVSPEDKEGLLLWLDETAPDSESGKKSVRKK